MSRSAAAPTQHHEERALRRPVRPNRPGPARRMSGPATAAGAHAARTAQAQGRAHAYAPAPGYTPSRPAAPRRPSRPPLRLAAGGAAIALRVADSAVNVSASRTMDRLVRSRAWVVIIGVGLIGIVAMQVSMLKLNAGIGGAVNAVATLERSNASLKAEVSRLSSGDRIQALAGQKGFLMPEPADVTYLRAGDKRSDGLRAARRMSGPDPAIAGPAGATTSMPDALAGAPGAGAGAPGTATTTSAPTASTATVTTAPAGATTAPAAGTQAAPLTPQATAPPAASDPSAVPAAVTPAPVASQTTDAGGVTPP
jgi:cell division protein FtsB